MKKAQTLVNDTEKKKFQNIIDEIQNVIDEECKQKRKDDQEKLVIKCLKRKAYIAQKSLDSFAMGVMVGMSMT